MKHTPTPWVYWPDHYAITTDTSFINEQLTIAKTSCGNGAEHENAAFIVRACNAHGELLGACKRLADADGRVYENHEQADKRAEDRDQAIEDICEIVRGMAA